MESFDEVQFETDKQMPDVGQGKSRQKKTLFEDRLEGLVVKVSGGYIKDKDQARYVVIGLSLVLLVVSIYLMFS